VKSATFDEPPQITAGRLPKGNLQVVKQFSGQRAWDRNPVWEKLGKRVTAKLEPMPVVDDAGFPQQGTHSVGVKQ
jgi:hypothetical protein